MKDIRIVVVVVEERKRERKKMKLLYELVIYSYILLIVLFCLFPKNVLQEDGFDFIYISLSLWRGCVCSFCVCVSFFFLLACV